MEEFHKNCGFILTCNYKNRLIPPLQSRCSVVDFVIPNKQRPKLAQDFFKSVTNILKKENVEYDKKVVLELITKYFPDWRRILNALQRYSASGKIDAGLLVNLQEVQIHDLMVSLKKKEFTKVREWVVQHIDNDPIRIYRLIYDSLYDFVDDSTIPHAVVCLADYSYKSAFVADQEINLLACLTELMAQCKFK